NTAFEVAKLVEHEQRVIAGASVTAVPHAHLLPAVGRAHATAKRRRGARRRRVRWGASRYNGSRRPRTSLLLSTCLGQWIDPVHGRRPPRGVVLDIYSLVTIMKHRCRCSATA